MSVGNRTIRLCKKLYYNLMNGRVIDSKSFKMFKVEKFLNEKFAMSLRRRHGGGTVAARRTATRLHGRAIVVRTTLYDGGLVDPSHCYVITQALRNGKELF